MINNQKHCVMMSSIKKIDGKFRTVLWLEDGSYLWLEPYEVITDIRTDNRYFLTGFLLGVCLWLVFLLPHFIASWVVGVIK
jgi:hypothetical protein